MQANGNHYCDYNDKKLKNFTVCSASPKPFKLLFEKQTKALVESIWIHFSCFIIFIFGIQPPKVLSTAFAQINPKDFPLSEVSILMPPAALSKLGITAVNAAQPTVVVVIRLKHCMSLTKTHKPTKG